MCSSPKLSLFLLPRVGHCPEFCVIHYHAYSAGLVPRYGRAPNQHITWLHMLLFFLSCFFFNFILFFNFTILYWFCHISKWIRHRYTCVPHPEPSSLLPPHTIPLGRPSAPAPSIQYCALNLDWQLVSYMIFYMFQWFRSHNVQSDCVRKFVDLLVYKLYTT